MSLADEINALKTTVTCCTTCVWWRQQDPDVQDAFNAYLARQDPKRPYYRPLWELCCENGLTVSDKSFREHCRNHHKAS